jgi:hypothetical protein
MEAFNTKALYDALKKIHDLVNSLDENCGVDPIEVRDIAREALSKPPRNCDVGNVAQQGERYRDTTDNVYHTLTLVDVLKWEQEPYTQEKKGKTNE